MKRASYKFMVLQKMKKKRKTKSSGGFAGQKRQKDSENSNQHVDDDLEEAYFEMFSEDLYDGANVENSVFSDSYYNDSDKDEVKFGQLAVDRSYRVSRKEALTSIEAKTPFIVGKLGSKKLCIEENDIVYKTIPKMQFREQKSSKLIGYLEVSDNLKTKQYRDKNVVGVLNDEYVVTKKKGHGHKAVGYIKLEEDNSNFDKYVEVTESNIMIKILVWLLVILFALILCTVKLPESWSLDGLTLTKVEETNTKIISNVEISHSDKIYVRDGKVSMGLTIIAPDDIDYRIVFVDGETEIYTSDMLNNDSIMEYVHLFSNTEYGQGEYDCLLRCDFYRKGNYISNIESDFVLVIE